MPNISKSDKWIIRLFAKNSVAEDRFTVRLRDMLKIVETMYGTAMDGILNLNDYSEARRDSINTWDRELAVFEESIRREVLVDISTRREDFISRRLMILSLIKDVERMGDYIKNIFRIVTRKTSVLQDDYRDDFVALVDWTRAAFSTLDAVLAEDNAEAAKILCQQAHEKSKAANKVVDSLMTDPKKSATPVATSLIFLFHKRLLRHMFNVGSSVVMPYERIDYFDPRIYQN
jgi:Na+/phosphate symporter